ncbi:MAG: hypothetical protein MJE66_01450 [Proteobacteria bacterium]|nr:hypothetical protein [Pseudomonadota bacterium]
MPLSLVPLSLEALLEQTTFRASDPEALDVEAIHQTLEKHAFARIAGVVSPGEVEAARAKLHENFDAGRDRPSLGEDPQELKENFQKLSIGGAQGYGVYRPRCIRTLYNPIWAEDVYGMREIFRKVARVRNAVYGLPRDFAIEGVEDQLWTAARIHHYPRGGGFLVSHRDIVVPKVQQKQGLPDFYQLIVVLSRKGVDFEEGGGFVERDGERYYYESACDYGDIVIYDGRTVHGVGDIDPHLAFQQDSIAGRLVGFVTLYKDMQRGEKV